MKKVLKIKIGEIYKDGVKIPVYQTAWRKTSKKGEKYYAITIPIFVQEIPDAPKEDEILDV